MNAHYAKQDGKIYRFTKSLWRAAWLKRNPDACKVSAREIQAELLRAARHASRQSPPASEWCEIPLLPGMPHAGPTMQLILPDAHAKPGRATRTPVAAAWQPGTAPSVPIPPDHPFACLSPRELEIAALVAHSHANESIAYRLGISPGTVAVYVSRMMDKLGHPVTKDRAGSKTYRLRDYLIGGPWIKLERASKASAATHPEK